MRKTVSGFTIVELLIVIVVIAILAAVSIVAYNGVQNRANDTAVQTDLANAAERFEIYRIDYGSFPQTSTDLANLGVSATKSAYMISPNLTYNYVPCVTAGGVDYTLGAISKSGNRYYVGSKSGGVKQATSASDWTSGYSTICNDTLSGTGIVSGTGVTGYGGAWRAWVGN